MVKKNEEDTRMKVLTQKELEERVLQNSEKYKDTIERVTSEIQNQNLKKGRVRPKDSIEAKILEQFNKGVKKQDK